MIWSVIASSGLCRGMAHSRFQRSAVRPAIGLACLGLVATSIGVAAQPVPCDAAVDPRQRQAIDAAEAWFGAHWRRAGARWTATYVLRQAAPLPLGIGSFGATKETFGSAAATPGKRGEPISGEVAIASKSCTVYEINPGSSHVVRLLGRGLAFNESNGGWTPARPRAVLHVLVIGFDASGVASPVRDLPEARTALPPEMQLLAGPEMQAAPPPVGKQH